MKNTLLFAVNTVLMALLLIMVWQVYRKLPETVGNLQPSGDNALLSTAKDSSRDTLPGSGMLLQPEEQIVLSNMLREIVGSEIRTQLADSLRDIRQAQSASTAAVNGKCEKHVALTDEQQHLYQNTQQLLTDVANGAVWTQDIDQQFEATLAQLPAKESFELARLQAKLISQGVIDIPTRIAGDEQQ